MRDAAVVLVAAAILAVSGYMGLPNHWVLWWAALLAVAVVVLWIKRRYW